MKKTNILILSLSISACASNISTEAKVASWEDWELCHRLADFVFKSESEWLWYAKNELINRKLTTDEKCESIYESRIQMYERDTKRSLISISFQNVVANNSEKSKKLSD